MKITKTQKRVRPMNTLIHRWNKWSESQPPNYPHERLPWIRWFGMQVKQNVIMTSGTNCSVKSRYPISSPADICHCLEVRAPGPQSPHLRKSKSSPQTRAELNSFAFTKKNTAGVLVMSQMCSLTIHVMSCSTNYSVTNNNIRQHNVSTRQRNSNKRALAKEWISIIWSQISNKGRRSNFTKAHYHTWGYGQLIQPQPHWRQLVKMVLLLQKRKR